MSKKEVVFLNEDHQIVSEAEATFRVETEYDTSGNVISEKWFNLKSERE